MNLRRLAALTALTMCAFAANSVLCRLALRDTQVDAASFTAIRLASGALALALILAGRHGGLRGARGSGSWASALALFVYAGAFSLAYEALTTGTGALLLFGAVQLTMIGYGIWNGERFTVRRGVGSLIAAGGLVVLVAPGLEAPPVLAAASMTVAGLAWGAYSIRGRGSADALRDTTGNFARAVPLGLLMVAVLFTRLDLDIPGVALAVASGALASGAGYAVWYTVLPHMPAVSAALVQLSVPLIAAVAGVLILGEAVTLRLVLAAVATLGGLWLALGSGRSTPHRGARSVPP